MALYNSLHNCAYNSALLAGFDDPAIDKAIFATYSQATRIFMPSVQQEVYDKKTQYFPPAFTNGWLHWLHKQIMKPQSGLTLVERGFYRSRVKQNIATF